MNGIYTIGHSNHTTDYFLQLLSKYKINSIVDVRSVPFSKYVPQYNKDNIKKILNQNNIYHVYMGEELGVIKDNKNLLSEEGYLDFEKLRETESFKIGIKRIKEGYSKGYNIAIMCTEKNPLDCHRSILIGRELYNDGYDIIHILPEGEVEHTAQLEQRLLNLYFPLSDQQDCFHIIEANETAEEVLDKAYKLRNRDIGYRADKDN